MALMGRNEAGGRDSVVEVFQTNEHEDVEVHMRIYDVPKTLNLPAEEPLMQSLERMKRSLKEAKATLQQKGTKYSEEAMLFLKTDFNSVVEMLDGNGEKIKHSTCNREAWQKGKKLMMNDLTFNIVHNPPRVVSAELVASPLVGMPIYPRIHLRNASLENTKFTWYRKLQQPSSPGRLETSGDFAVESHDTSDSSGWELIGNDKTYTATQADVGYYIQLSVMPGSEHFPICASASYQAQVVSTTTRGTVATGPGRCIFDHRISLTTDRCKAGSFRIVSYNILADFYAGTEYAHNFDFPHCPDYAIDIGYRKQLFMKEIVGYNSDIVCLQEVDRSVFDSYVMPSMSLEGYDGAFAAKDGLEEGLAMFYKKDKFRQVLVEKIVLREAVKERRNEDLYSRICESEDFRKNLLARETCLQVSVLQSLEDESRQILLGNNHLYWHFGGGQVRLIQMEIVLRELRRLHAMYSKNGSTLACIIVGDLNSHPYSAVVQLLAEGHVPETHADWFSMGRPERLKNMSLHNPVKLKSACGYPNYTNYVADFIGCLDYIFIDPRFFDISRVIPQPSHDEVVEFAALPSKTAPSDHIAQVVDLAWKSGVVRDAA